MLGCVLGHEGEWLNDGLLATSNLPQQPDVTVSVRTNVLAVDVQRQLWNVSQLACLDQLYNL